MSVVPHPADPAAALGRPDLESRELTLRFTGTAREYFRIWIVNLCLTLLTLGIFSAWAKVRKKRYFYSHTTLDCTPFQYLGQPIPILKGRLIAVVVFGAWYIGTNYVFELVPIIALVLIVLAPWVMVRSAAFNARYSAFRNMTFEFQGSYWSAAKVLYGWLVITVLTFGVGFSWWQQRLKQYMVSRYHYGGVPGEFAARGAQFFRIYFIAGLLFGGIMAVAATVFGFAVAANLKTGDGTPPLSYLVVFSIVVYALYAVAFAYMQARIGNLTWNHTQLGPIKFASSLSARELIWLYVTNALAILGSLGLLIPWAMIRTVKYRLSRLSVTVDGLLSEFQGGSTSSVQAAGAEVGEFFDFDMSL